MTQSMWSKQGATRRVHVGTGKGGVQEGGENRVGKGGTVGQEKKGRGRVPRGRGSEATQGEITSHSRGRAERVLLTKKGDRFNDTITAPVRLSGVQRQEPGTLIERGTKGKRKGTVAHAIHEEQIAETETAISRRCRDNFADAGYTEKLQQEGGSKGCGGDRRREDGGGADCI